MKARTVSSRLRTAERQCVKRGVRWTPLRRRVLEMLFEADRPIGAYELLNRFATAQMPRMPPSIYRALEFLIEHGFVHKLVSLNAFVACADFSQPPHDGQFAICTGCGKTVELRDSALDANLKRDGRDLGFRINQQIVELQGLCRVCRQSSGLAAEMQ